MIWWYVSCLIPLCGLIAFGTWNYLSRQPFSISAKFHTALQVQFHLQTIDPWAKAKAHVVTNWQSASSIRNHWSSHSMLCYAMLTSVPGPFWWHTSPCRQLTCKGTFSTPHINTQQAQHESIAQLVAPLVELRSVSKATWNQLPPQSTCPKSNIILSLLFWAPSVSFQSCPHGGKIRKSQVSEFQLRAIHDRRSWAGPDLRRGLDPRLAKGLTIRRRSKTKFTYTDGHLATYPHKEMEPGTNSPIPQLPTEESRSTRAEKKPVDEFIHLGRRSSWSVNVLSVEGRADGCFTSMSHSFATQRKITKGKLHRDVFCHSDGTLLNKLAHPSFRPMTVGLLTRKRMTSLKQKDMLLALCAKIRCRKWHITFEKFRNRLGHTEVSGHTAPAKH